MTIFKHLLGAAVLAISLTLVADMAQGAKVGEKAAMQAAMQQYVDRSLVDGAYLHMDMKSGEVRRLYPNKAHPMIFAMGEFFVLCSEFRDEKDKSVNVDFYMARENDLFVVSQAAVQDRVMLKKQIGAGKAKRVN